jgi:tyrosinase
LEEVMHTLSRRALLGASAFGALIPSLLLDSRRADAATRIRHDLTTTEGQKNIKTYAKGFDLIMKLPERDPRGWLFQWYTHAVRNDRTKAGEISRVYGSTSGPDKQLAQDTWNTCQPHNPPFSSDMFLPWHRMFVLCLEQIVRQLTKEDAFNIPYWNYTQAGQRALPAEFRKQGDPTWGSLYRQNRITQVNAGTPIDQVPGSSPFDLSAMKFNVYSGGSGFCANLDNNPHGIVHDDIGNGQGMGSVPWAANDPIFWIHHCNIDHIWASWNKAGGKNPALTGTFTFADRDGKKVVLEVSKFLDTLTQGYEYDKYLPRPPGSLPFPPANALVAAFALHATSAQTSGPVSLGAAPVTVTLAAAPSAPGAPAPASGNDALTKSLQAVPAERQFILQLNDVKAMSRPGVNYDVYYGLAEGQTPSHDSPAYAGSLSFFGVAPHGDMGQMQMPGHNFSFLITQPVRQALAGAANAATKVTLVPTGAPASDSMPTIGSISLVSA